MSGVEELAVTILALAILMYLLCKWGVFKCCSSRQAQLTTVPSAPHQQAPTLALDVALVRNQTLQMQQSGIQQGQSEKCREMQRNTGKYREIKRRQFYITCPVGIWLGCISKWLGWIPTVAQLRDSTYPPPPLTYFLHIKLSVPKRKKSHILPGFFWKTSLRDVKFQTYGRTYMCI